MRKRISTKVYDTDTADIISKKEGLYLYQKRSRERGLFIVNGDKIIPVSRDLAMAMFPDAEISPRSVGSSGYRICVDQKTYDKLLNTAQRRNTTMSNIVAMLVEEMK